MSQAEQDEAIFFRSNSHSQAGNTWEGQQSSQEVIVTEAADMSYQLMEKPDAKQIQEIVGLLKVKTSMLAMGACERIKKLSKAFPSFIINSPILIELIHILEDGPGTPLANAAMSAMSTMALVPEGRQRIVILGGAPPVIKLIARCDLARPNTDRAIQLLMNLSADGQNRRAIREAGGVESLVALMKVAAMDHIMEHALGALHNVMLTDAKAKQRAMEAGVAQPLARVLAAKLDDTHPLSVRVRMLIADLLRVQDMQERLVEAAESQGIRIPGLMAARRTTNTSQVLNSARNHPTSSNGQPSPRMSTVSMGHGAEGGGGGGGGRGSRLPSQTGVMQEGAGQAVQGVAT